MKTVKALCFVVFKFAEGYDASRKVIPHKRNLTLIDFYILFSNKATPPKRIQIFTRTYTNF